MRFFMFTFCLSFFFILQHTHTKKSAQFTDLFDASNGKKEIKSKKNFIAFNFHQQHKNEKRMHNIVISCA